MPDRCLKQCRQRYQKIFDPKNLKGAWSQSEDELIIQTYRQIGPSWMGIAKKLNNRTATNVMHRFREHLRYFLDHDDEVDLVPNQISNAHDHTSTKISNFEATNEVKINNKLEIHHDQKSVNDLMLKNLHSIE